MFTVPISFFSLFVYVAVEMKKRSLIFSCGVSAESRSKIKEFYAIANIELN